MITIVYNDSNVTLYRIPMHDKETKVFALPHRSDPQALQILIDWFNHTLASSIVPASLPTTKSCYTQNVLLIIIAGFLVLFLLLVFLFLLFIGRQRQHRYHRAQQYKQSSICVTDVPDSETNNLDTDSKITDSNDNNNTDDNNIDAIKKEVIKSFVYFQTGNLAHNTNKTSNSENNPALMPTTTTTTRTVPLIQPMSISSMEEINTRISLLPAFPSFEQSTATNRQDHLLLANISRQWLTNEQRRCYRERDNFQSSFQITDRTSKNQLFSSFFLVQYRALFVDLTRRLHINDAVIDYNYQRLLKCFDIMTNERIKYGLQSHPYTDGDVLPLHEYAIALEFFLQIDRNVFFMKTCSFRGAITRLSFNFDGLFCLVQPYASYGMTACQISSCYLCFPPSNVPHQTGRQHQPVAQFSAAQEHIFVSGYRAILNCPATCQTKNILYVLTCPCGQYDYVGYTSMTLDGRLAYHREHGNRIIHEFILGAKNILRVQTKPKSNETLVKDDMLLYKHSARCPAAMQLFLDCNPQYWPFIPMLQQESQNDNRFYRVPASIPRDPSSPLRTSSEIRSDHEAGCCMTDLPPLPSTRYTFSTRQCVEQFLYFKNRQDYYWPNFNLNLYQAAIIAVLPDQCSTPLCRLLEALFITHAQTKLNTIGHLDSNVTSRIHINKSRLTEADLIVDRGDWCHHLLLPPSTT